jgi:branched-chain amino acid aminotransferase
MSKFPETEWIWRDGEIVPWAVATVHVMSHVIHYGSAVFEGIRCYATPEAPSIFRLNDHLRRLHDSARIYRMGLGHDVDTLAAACTDLVRRNRLAECYIRPIALRGYGAAGVLPYDSPVETYIVCWPWGAYLGDGALERGVDACVSSWSRPAPNTMPVLAKAAGNYLNSQLMKMEAHANGFAEAIALTPDGRVSEGSGQNIFVVRDGVLITPGSDGTLLPGITRDCVLRLAAELAIPVREETVPRGLLYTADEVFFTGTAVEVTPIRSIDRTPVGDGQPGPITRALQKRLLEIARGETPDRYGWRTLVQSRTGEAVA